MKKRILSILLTLCMVLALCPVAAFADTGGVTYTVTRNFKYGTLLVAVDGNTHQTSPYTQEIKLNGRPGLGTVIDCAPYKFVGWKETGSGTVYAPFTMITVLSDLTFDALYEVDGSLAITVDGFQVGKTPADTTLSFASTIPGVTFSKDDIRGIEWLQFTFDGVANYTWNPAGSNEVFQADTAYRIIISLNNNGLELVPATTVNGIAPQYSEVAYNNGVPYAIYMDFELGTPAAPSQYTITYEGGEGAEGSIAPGVKARGEDFTLSSDTFTWDGFIQTGWIDEYGAIYDLGGIYTLDEDMTFSPYWEKIITLTVPYTTTVALGDVGVPGEKTFTLALIGDSAPDKDKSNVTVSGSVTTNGKGSYNGTLTFTGPEGTLWVMLSEGAFVQQVDNGEAGWTVDDTVWGVLMDEIPVAYATSDDAVASKYTVYVVPASIDGQGNYTIDWNNLQTADMAFTNTYTAHVYELKHDTTHHWDECDCGDIQNKEAHTYGDWKVTKEATEKEAGEKEHTCTVCGYTEKVEIPKRDIVPTGDDSSFALWAALFAVSAAAVITTATVSKKKKAGR